MKERLRELNIKLTELSEYVKVSRPTLYKYINSYEEGDFKSLPDDVLALFRFMERDDATKESVVSFAISSFSETEDVDAGERIRKYFLSASETNPKTEFVSKLISSDVLDDILPYLSNYIDIMTAKDFSEEKLYQIARLVNLRSNVTKNVPLKEEELSEAKKNLGGNHGQ